MRSNSGETLAEALVTFLIAVLSAIVLATTLLVAMKMSKNGEYIMDKLVSEENEIQLFLADSGYSNSTSGKLIVSSEGVDIAQINIIEMKTGINELFAYKKE